MIKLHKFLSAGLGIGYMGKGGGTVASVAACICWYIAWAGRYNAIAALVITIVITLYGVWAATAVEPDWGEDSSKVVLDEIAGMCITLLFIPVNIPNMVAGLVLFRFFDIAKPLFIKKVENLPSGWGVMGDDVLAGVYSNIILQLIVYMQLW